VTSSDAPQPPGGPLREDEPDGPIQPTTEDEESEQSEEAAAIQQENAETSLDQPSQ
jgi:hypothetical protein